MEELTVVAKIKKTIEVDDADDQQTQLEELQTFLEDNEWEVTFMEAGPEDVDMEMDDE